MIYKTRSEFYRSFACKRPSIRALAVIWICAFVTVPGFCEVANTDEAMIETPSQPLVPAELPSFKVLDENYTAVPTSRFRGKVVLLDFWASWCRPCLFTLPELERLHQEYGGRDDFSVVGFAIDEGRGGGVRARKFAAKSGVTYETFHDFASKPAAPQFKVEAVPVLFLIDAEGKIRHRWEGEPDFSEVEAAVKAVLGIDETKDVEAVESDSTDG